jgi:alpha-galactosidase
MLSVMEIAEINNQWARLAGNGYWNDPDMLITGEHGLTNDEQKSHFALWCIMSAPLMLGNDPRNMNRAERDIVLNRDAIAIDQDPTEQGIRIIKDGGKEVWVKHLQDGNVAVLLLNRNQTNKQAISLDLETIGIGSPVRLRDIYANKDAGSADGTLSVDVEPRSSAFIKLLK